ncbi:MAG: uroporphyrinogen decarboxylase family protein [Candidatus Bathyarchaeota archaeon]|nr:uroporphyrinogen decarboxylase family protein [Candidatus Bathyarchaeota archaeon]
MFSTPYEDIIAVFERRGGRIPWNIRHEFWYYYNLAKGTLPDRYKGMSLIDVCLDWGASWRYYSGYFTDSFVKVSYTGGVDVERVVDGRAIITEFKTPKGVLRQISLKDEYGLTSRIVEYPVKNLEDLKPLEYILENIEVRFDSETYSRVEGHLKGHGIVSYFFPRSPYQRLILEYMGFERTIRFLSRYKREVEDFMKTIESSNSIFYDAIASTPIKVLNLGENIDVRMTPPRIFERYCLPYYQERADYLHRRGKYVHIHVDGYAKPLLPLLRESRLDGVEALTVKPVGDMTLEDVAKGLGDEMIILDGIPYIYFIPEAVNLEKFDEFVEKIISMFKGRLILGISDELPPPADISRVQRIPEMIDRVLRS